VVSDTVNFLLSFTITNYLRIMAETCHSQTSSVSNTIYAV